LRTPRAAAAAGVIFAVLFAAVLVLVRTALPEGAAPGSQWLEVGSRRIEVAALLMPFSGISFLWFIGVLRDGFGRLEDKFFSSVFLGSGLLFLAMMFTASAVGAGLAASSNALGESAAHSDVASFGRMLLLTLSKTYALRMAAVFMMSLATIWLRTGLMPRWLTVVSYISAIALIIGGDTTMWLVLAFPLWVLIVSVLFLVRAGMFEHRGEEQRHHEHHEHQQP